VPSPTSSKTLAYDSQEILTGGLRTDNLRLSQLTEIEMLQVSNTSTSLARACWQKYMFSYKLGLKPREKAPPVTIGTVVHDGFHRRYQGDDLNKVLHNVHSEFTTAILNCSPEVEEDLILGKHTALGMLEFYPESLLNFESIESEKSFSVPLVDDIMLMGRIDGEVVDQHQNWLRELKTTGLALQPFKGRQNCSYQSSIYLYGMTITTGKQYEGVMYDVIRKPKLEKRVAEDAEQFGKRIYEDYASTTTNVKKRRSYFERMFIYRSKFQMECFQEDIKKLALEMKRRLQDNDFYRNPDACWLWNRQCEYSPICWKKDWDQSLVNSLYDQKHKATP